MTDDRYLNKAVEDFVLPFNSKSNTTLYMIVKAEAIPTSTDVFISANTIVNLKDFALSTKTVESINGGGDREILKGANLNVATTAVFSDKTTYNATDDAVITSSATNIVTVSGKTLTAVFPGESTISVEYGGKSASFNVTVPLKAVSVEAGDDRSVRITETDALSVSAVLNNDTNEADVVADVEVTVDDPTVATYDATSKLFTALKVGSTVVTVSYLGASDTFTITVPNEVISISAGNDSKLTKDKTLTLKIIATMTDGTKQDISALSGLTVVSLTPAHVSVEGVVLTGVAKGTSQITVTYEASYGDITTTINITVVDAAATIDAGEDRSLSLGATSKLVLNATYDGVEGAVKYTYTKTSSVFDDLDFLISKDTSVKTDCRGAEELWYYVNASEFGTNPVPIRVNVEEGEPNTGVRESWTLKANITTNIITDGSSTRSALVTDGSGYTVLPAGFTGWVCFPFNTDSMTKYWSSGNTNNVLDKQDVHQFIINVKANSTAKDKPLYLDEFSIVGDELGFKEGVTGLPVIVSGLESKQFRRLWNVDNIDEVTTQVSKNSVAADELELSYLNGMLGSVIGDDAKYVTYNTPMIGLPTKVGNQGYDGKKISSTIDIRFQHNDGSPDFTCCQANASRGVGQLSEWGVLTDKNSVYVNYYGASAANTLTPSGKAITLKQTTEYPKNGKIVLEIEGLELSETFSLKLRIPGWAKQNFVKLNSDATVAVRSGQYYEVNREWKNGDKVELDLDMSVHFWKGEEGETFEDYTSVYYGPILMTLDENVTPDKTNQNIKFAARSFVDVEVTSAIEEGHWLYFDVKDTKGDTIRLVDFASCGQFVEGNPENPGQYYTWLQVSDSEMEIIDRDNLERAIWHNMLSYKIAKANSEIVVDASANAGNIVSFYVEVPKGKAVEAVKVASSKGNLAIELEDGGYNFEMPNENVTVSVTLVDAEKGGCKGESSVVGTVAAVGATMMGLTALMFVKRKKKID